MNQSNRKSQINQQSEMQTFTGSPVLPLSQVCEPSSLPSPSQSPWARGAGEGEGQAHPPYTNRGDVLTNEVESRPDYLTGTTWGIDLETVKSTLSSMLGAAEFVDMPYGGNFYQIQSRTAYGAKIYYTPGREDILVWIPGKACEYLGFHNIFLLITLLNMKVSRFDYCFNHVDISPMMLREAWESNRVSTRVKRNSCTYLKDGDGYESFYIGNAKYSEKTLVCYNKRGYNRLEFRLRGETAERVMQSLLEAPTASEQINIVLGVMTAFVDFVDRNETNVSRSSRLDWWAALVNDVSKIRYAVEKKVQMAHEVVEHFLASQLPTFAAVCEIMHRWGGGHPWDIAKDYFTAGQRRWKPKHKALVALAGSSPGYVPF